jgi:hypothetical protein
MKALISAVALLGFIAATTMPMESYAQATGGAQTVAPESTTGTPSSTTTKKKKTSSKRAHKTKKKSTTGQTSAAKKKHNSIHASKRSRHIAS